MAGDFLLFWKVYDIYDPKTTTPRIHVPGGGYSLWSFFILPLEYMFGIICMEYYINLSNSVGLYNNSSVFNAILMTEDTIMDENNKIQLFEDKRIRTAWNEEEQEWYFSVVDVVSILTDQATPRSASTYWAVLKKRLIEEGAQLLINCKQLKMKAADGKKRLTDVANTEQLLRIIQSIPSPKAEPFKMWLAQVGRERIEETIDPELTIDRALVTYLKKGYTREWINQRLQAIQVRKELTDE